MNLYDARRFTHEVNRLCVSEKFWAGEGIPGRELPVGHRLTLPVNRAYSLPLRPKTPAGAR